MLVPLLQELNKKLRWAARDGWTEEVKALLRQGADIECTDWVRHGYTLYSSMCARLKQMCSIATRQSGGPVVFQYKSGANI